VIFNWIAKWGDRRIRLELQQLGYGEDENRLVVNVETGDLSLKRVRPDFELSAD
jgi:hypothetical protein